MDYSVPVVALPREVGILVQQSENLIGWYPGLMMDSWLKWNVLKIGADGE